MTTQEELIGMRSDDNRQFQNKLYSEIKNLKSDSRAPSRGDPNYEQVRKERNELQEENRRLIGLVR